MKKIFNNLLDAIIGIEEVYFGIESLKESIQWKKLYNFYLIEAETEEEKTLLSFDAKQLLLKVNKYRIVLKNYSENYEFYDRTNTIQERDLKYTSDKFFTEVVSPIRHKALNCLKQIKKMINNSKNNEEKNILKSVSILILNSTNQLINICSAILQYNKELLIDNLKSKGIDFKKKYELFPIEWKEV